MYRQVVKSKESKSRSVANSILLNKSDSKQIFRSVENRDEVLRQGKIQGLMSNRLQVSQLKDISVGSGGDKTTVHWKEGKLAGSSDPVGMYMKATNLHDDHVDEGELIGSVPKSSAQKHLMSLLPTNPNLKSTNKYIKGHLLNHNIGGPGEDYNLFPITASANSAHHKFVEKYVKNWVLKEGKHVDYVVGVKVHKDGSGGASNKGGNVSATFDCVAKTNDGNNISQSITSIPESKAQVAPFGGTFSDHDDTQNLMFQPNSIIGEYYENAVVKVDDPDQLESMREKIAKDVFQDIKDDTTLGKKIVKQIRGKEPQTISGKMYKEIYDLILDMLIVFAEFIDDDQQKEFQQEHPELTNHLTS